MTKLNELVPGDKVELFGKCAVFIGLGRNADYPNLALVTWRLDNGELSFDSLRFDQEIGVVMTSTRDERRERLLVALRGDWNGT